MAIQHLVSLMSKELLNVKWHKIQSCWCENLSSRVRFSFLSRNHKFLLNWMASIINEASHELKYHLSPFLFQLPKKLQLLLSCTSCSWFITVHWSSISYRDWLWKKLYYSCFVTRFHQCFWSYQRIEKQLLRTKELLIFFDDQDDHKTWAEKISFFSSTCDKMAAFWLTNLH